MTAPKIPDKVPVPLLDGIAGVRFSYVTEYPKLDVKRSMSELLHRGLEGFCRELYALGVRTIIHQGVYSARSVRNGTDWSNHAYALAIDLYAFVFESGTVVPVSEWKISNKVYQIEMIWRIARRYFSEVITPADNKLHADHIHVGYSGKRYEREKATWYKAWDAVSIDGYTAQEKAIALSILKESVWDDYIGIDGDPATHVRNVITDLVKQEFGLS